MILQPPGQSNYILNLNFYFSLNLEFREGLIHYLRMSIFSVDLGLRFERVGVCVCVCMHLCVLDSLGA